MRALLQASGYATTRKMGRKRLARQCWRTFATQVHRAVTTPIFVFLDKPRRLTRDGNCRGFRAVFWLDRGERAGYGRRPLLCIVKRYFDREGAHDATRFLASGGRRPGNNPVACVHHHTPRQSRNGRCLAKGNGAAAHRFFFAICHGARRAASVPRGTCVADKSGEGAVGGVPTTAAS